MAWCSRVAEKRKRLFHRDAEESEADVFAKTFQVSGINQKRKTTVDTSVRKDLCCPFASSLVPGDILSSMEREKSVTGAWKAEWWSVSMSAHRGGIGYCFGPLFPKQTASTLFRQEICSARQAGRTGNGLLSVLLFVINTGSRRRFSLQRAHNSRAVSIAAEHRTVKIF